MIIVPEKEIAALMGRAEAFAAVESVFASMSRGDAYNFPLIREALGEGRQYGFKSGLDRKGGVMGVKAGGYFPGNADRGIPNHQSTVYLFDPESGKPTATVGGNLLTALRTAAASSVSIKHLSREDSKVIGMVGAGHQSTFQLRAAVEQRNFEKVVAWNPHPEMLPNLAKVADELGLPFEAVEPAELGAQADVIITITSAFEPLMMKDWIKPGTHIACMGTDTKGKQEVDAALVAAAKVFTDEVAQSVTIGECQHAIAQGLIKESDIGEIGAVINGTIPGRVNADDITLFDGTGVGLQDLAVAAAVVDLAVEKGIAIEVDF